MEALNSGAPASLLDDLLYPIRLDCAALAEPQCLEIALRMVYALAQVAIERYGSLLAERACAGSAALADHQGDVQLKVDVDNRHAGELTSTHPVSSRSRIIAMSRRSSKVFPSHDLSNARS
jgi:hypothetical protein